MFELKKETLLNISKNTGIPIEELFDTDRVDVNVKFSKELKPGIAGRGNPYCSRRRFTTMEEVDEKMDKMIARNKRRGARTRKKD